MKNNAYRPLSKFFHWTIALIVIPMVTGSFYIDTLSKASQGTVIMLHKSFGLLVLALMLMRISYLLIAGRPDLPPTVATWERVLARFVQYSLYISLILMPLCGWMMSTAAGHPPVFFKLVTLPFPGISPNELLSNQLFLAHQIIAYIILGLLFLHISGALNHHFIDKDNVLNNMLFSREK
jgi:cytochrome b561